VSNSIQTGEYKRQRAWDRHLAYAISMVGSPPVLATTVIGLTASTIATLKAWVWASVYVLLAIFTPLLNVFLLVRRGRVTDIDVCLREQRIRPLLFSIVCSTMAWVGLRLGHAPRELQIIAGAVSLQMAIVLAITLRWKISMHCAAAAGAATVLWSLMGTPVPMMVGVPIIAWSRIRLRRHTLGQTVAGSLLGISVFLPMLALIQ
jgi:membrane-associated phospholipid phosphatase